MEMRLLAALGLLALFAALLGPAEAASFGCRSVVNASVFQRFYKRNPGLQSASQTDLPVSQARCLLLCSNQKDIIGFAAFSNMSCFCGNASVIQLATASCASPQCSAQDTCFLAEQTVSDATVLSPIVNATVAITASPAPTGSVVIGSSPTVTITATSRFPAAVTAHDTDPAVSNPTQIVVPVPAAQFGSTLLRPTYTNRRSLVYVKFTTAEATDYKSKVFKVMYSLGGIVSMEMDFANNTPGYYPVMQEFRVNFRVSLGSNLTARIDFGDGTPLMQMPTLTDTFPVTYRRGAAFNGFGGQRDAAFTVTVFTSLRVDANVTITAVAAFVNSSSLTNVSLLVLRPLCGAGLTYCYRANACSSNCTALAGARATACAAAGWSTVPRTCRSAASPAPALFSGGSYYIDQSVGASLSAAPNGSFQVVSLLTNLNCIPGDMLALYDPQGVVMSESATTAETEIALSWNTSFNSGSLNGTTVKTVNLANATARPSSKALQFYGNRQVSVMGTHNYTSVGCSWIASYCNSEYPFNVSVYLSGASGVAASARLPVIIQIPIINVTFSVPTYFTSRMDVPFQIGQFSGSKPVHTWSVNDSALSNFNSTMLARTNLTAATSYNFTADKFFNVCLTTRNQVSSFFVCVRWQVFIDSE